MLKSTLEVVKGCSQQCKIFWGAKWCTLQKLYEKVPPRLELCEDVLPQGGYK